MWKALGAKALVAVLLWPSLAAAEASDTGVVRVGDRWSYDVKDGLTGDLRNQITVVTVDVNEKEITTRVTRQGKPPITVVYDPHWGLIDSSNTKHKPNQIGMNLPLQVGKQWRSEWTTTKLESGNVFRANASAKVAGQETVTTPAGKFDA